MTATISGATRMTPAQLVSIANALARTDDAIRARVALVAVSTLAAVLYLWDLTVSGYANTYYSMAAQAASQSWSAWFFGSLDAGGFITLDKPPLATMLMGLSVRVLGLSPLTVLLPQALLGVATVGLLFLIVRGSFGTVAATIAAVVMALTPVAVLIYRYDNPDALLTFLLVASAGTLLRAIETGRGRWLVATGVLIGAAFLTKYLQAYLVVPGFVFAYLVAARGSLRRRLAEVVAFGVVTLAASGWWVVAVELIPASSRPYIGGSTRNSVLDLIFGYDGLGRIFGIFGFGPGPAGPSAAGAAGQVGGGPAGPSGAGGGFGGAPGLLRMFNDRFAGQIAWFLPASVCGLAAGIWARRRAGRRDRRLAAYLVWGSWLVTTVLVFSLMSGIIHSYYTVALAPAVAALAGAGAAEVWPRRRHPLARVGLAASIAGTGALAAALLSATPAFAPGLGFAILAVAV
ncbi:MAG TPA: glycosyltransferase family 39 protein, partial [Candidatus Dormibacteraeota bacterium]|nr:glycosyltransferase family 39 protein [Candidatus Dormibacteraeota bacterium]